jgi:hypothetical protein
VSDEFNPFREWLGREDGREPKSHYDLLGIAEDEIDGEVIARKADALTARIRRFRPGSHIAAWQRLLDAVAEAKECLLDPTRRAAYDVSLRGGSLEPGVQPPTAWHADAADHSDEVAYQGFDVPQHRRVSVPSRRPAEVPGALRLLAMVGVGMAVVLVLVVVRPRPSSPVPGRVAAAEETKETGSSPGVPDRGPPAEPHAKPAKTPPLDRTPPQATTSPGGGAEKPPAEDSASPAVTQALGRARAAMARRDLAGARQQLKAASQNAQSPADRTQIARVEGLLGNLEEFWKGMRQVLAGLQPTQEIMLGNTPAIVVSADGDSLTYRSEGANRTYTLKDMPGSVVLGLAQSGFSKAPSQKVLIGAFLAADGQGNPSLARQLWEEAAQQGEDVADLLAELGRAGAGVRPEVPDRQSPPRDPARLKNAREAMRRKFHDEFARATKALGKAALARKLIDEAMTAGADAASRYVLLEEARQQAAAAGKAALAFEAIDGMAAWFTVDPLTAKVATFEVLAKSAASIQGQREFVDAAIKTAIEASQAQRAEEAQKLAELALVVARRSKNAALIRSAQAARQEVGSARPSGAGDNE